jgi:hypothetical protein
MSIESASVLVAAFAVLVGAVFQCLTIRSTRRNTLSQLRTTLAEARVAALRNALAEYMSNQYWMDREQTEKKLDVQITPSGKSYLERGDEESRLHSLIRLCLVPGQPNHEQLLEDLEYLRENDADDAWLTRRDRLVETAREVLEAETRQALDD